MSTKWETKQVIEGKVSSRLEPLSVSEHGLLVDGERISGIDNDLLVDYEGKRVRITVEVAVPGMQPSGQMMRFFADEIKRRETFSSLPATLDSAEDYYDSVEESYLSIICQPVDPSRFNEKDFWNELQALQGEYGRDYLLVNFTTSEE